MFLTHTTLVTRFFFLPGVKWEVKLLRNKRSGQNGFKIIRLEWTQWSFFVAPKWFLHVVPKTCGLSMFHAPASLSNITHWSNSLNGFCLETQGTHWDAKLFRPFVRIHHENRLPFALCTTFPLEVKQSPVWNNDSHRMQNFVTVGKTVDIQDFFFWRHFVLQVQPTVNWTEPQTLSWRRISKHLPTVRPDDVQGPRHSSFWIRTLLGR